MAAQAVEQPGQGKGGYLEMAVAKWLEKFQQ